MSDGQDDYLWTGSGTPSDEVVALEHELGTLAWQPRALELDPPGVAPVAVTLTIASASATTTAKPRRAVKSASAARRGSPMLVAGLVAAAAVLMLVFWLRPKLGSVQS